jgi:hypothetical protein
VQLSKHTAARTKICPETRHISIKRKWFAKAETYRERRPETGSATIWKGSLLILPNVSDDKRYVYRLS